MEKYKVPYSVKRQYAFSLGLKSGRVSDKIPIKCVNCGKEGFIYNNGFGYIHTSTYLHFDHIEPFRVNQNQDISNFQILCSKCNQKKKYSDKIKYPVYV